MKVILKKEWIGALILFIILTIILLFNRDEISSEPVLKEVESYTIEAYINGSVKSPGVYTLNDGDRLNVLLDKAGGFLETAEKRQVNLARVIKDGEMVWIYEESNSEVKYIGVDYFNYESKENLMKIEGIGESTANKIINYRENIASFMIFEDLLNVEGIGEQKLLNIEAQFAND